MRIRVGAGLLDSLLPMATSFIPGGSAIMPAVSALSNFLPTSNSSQSGSSASVIAQKRLQLESKKRQIAAKKAQLAAKKAQAANAVMTSRSTTINDKLEPWNPPPTTAEQLDKEKNKSNYLMLGIGVLALGATVYVISNNSGRKK